MAGVAESVVLLHGFAGTHRAFDGVVAALERQRYRPHALDLPGHGLDSRVRGATTAAGAHRAVNAPNDHPTITTARTVEQVLEHSPPARLALCGYSMGGRLALHLALAQPHRVARLVLVSTSAGIDEEAARRERARSDERLARQLEEGSFERFIARWRAQPLFAGEPPHVRALALDDHRRNRARALAGALRALGPGAMAPVWHRLHELQMPVQLLAGERDPRYVEIGERMAALLPAARLTIVPGGHALLLENPRAVARAIEATPAPGGAI